MLQPSRNTRYLYELLKYLTKARQILPTVHSGGESVIRLNDEDEKDASGKYDTADNRQLLEKLVGTTRLVLAVEGVLLTRNGTGQNVLLRFLKQYRNNDKRCANKHDSDQNVRKYLHCKTQLHTRASLSKCICGIRRRIYSRRYFITTNPKHQYLFKKKQKFL